MLGQSPLQLLTLTLPCSPYPSPPMADFLDSALTLVVLLAALFAVGWVAVKLWPLTVAGALFIAWCWLDGVHTIATALN